MLDASIKSGQVTRHYKYKRDTFYETLHDYVWKYNLYWRKSTFGRSRPHVLPFFQIGWCGWYALTNDLFHKRKTETNGAKPHKTKLLKKNCYECNLHHFSILRVKLKDIEVQGENLTLMRVLSFSLIIYLYLNKERL